MVKSIKAASTSKGAKAAKGLCSFCKKAEVKQKGACRKCYWREYTCKTGECVGCGRTMKLVARKLCGACYVSGRRILGETHHAHRDHDKEAGQAARAFEDVFVKFLLPAVHRFVGRWFQYYGPIDREELLAETVAYGWLLFVRCVADGNDPVPRCENLAQYAVKHVYRWRRIAGKVSSVDVLSPRYQKVKGVAPYATTSMVDVGRPCHILGLKEWDVEHEEWLATLPNSTQRIIDFLLSGHNWTDARKRFCMTRYQMEKMVEDLWASWSASRTE